MKLSDLIAIIENDMLIRGDVEVSYLDLSTVHCETDPADYSYDEEDEDGEDECNGEACGC
jgi:hypothetical protein